jgi:hypothetical protein
MSEDMTYCMNKDCKKKKCERHASHIKDKTIPHSYAMYDCSAEKSSLWAISRPKNGISLNGREYVCDENGKVKLYDDINIAMLDLAFHGYDTRDVEREGIEIVEMQDCGDHYEPIVR